MLAPQVLPFFPHDTGAQLIDLSRLSGLDDSISTVLDDVECSGNEVRLIDCNSSKINSCFMQDVAVHCNRDGELTHTVGILYSLLTEYLKFAN